MPAAAGAAAGEEGEVPGHERGARVCHEADRGPDRHGHRTQQAKLSTLDADEQKKAGLITSIRAGLGAGDIAEDRLEGAVSYRLAEINKQAGTLAARLERYREEREKIAADQKTIRDAGADGVCPLCRQKLGEHFGSIEAEFSAKLQELEGKAVADLARQEKLGKETGRDRGPEAGAGRGPHP